MMLACLGGKILIKTVKGLICLLFHFTPGLDLDASNKFEEEGHKMEEVDSSVRGGGEGG